MPLIKILFQEVKKKLGTITFIQKENKPKHFLSTFVKV
jgi:hypothetical protein